MTQAEATEQVRTFAQADAWPRLSGDDVALCLQKARRRDAVGRLPDDTGYVLTWDINAAIAWACEIKAAKAASGYDFSSAGQSHSRSQVREFWEAQAKRFRARAVISMTGSGVGTGVGWLGGTIAGPLIPIDAADV